MIIRGLNLLKNIKNLNRLKRTKQIDFYATNFEYLITKKGVRITYLLEKWMLCYVFFLLCSVVYKTTEAYPC